MVSRLVSFAAAEQVEARPVDVTALLRNLIEFREGDWKASGIRVRDLTSREPLFVHGSQGQIEQVFLNLLVHAEQSLAEAPQKSITVRTSVLAKRLLVEISFTSPAELRKPEDTAAVLGVTRSVIAGHGGEVRLIEKNNSDPRFEVELPALVKDRSAPASHASFAVRDSSRRLTALVIEPDEAMQRQMLALLAGHGYRVVPVTEFRYRAGPGASYAVRRGVLLLARAGAELGGTLRAHASQRRRIHSALRRIRRGTVG